MKKKELAFIGAILLVYFAQKLFMCRLGIYMEECRDANAHLMVIEGMTPYRDFHSWVYGPFAFCFYPLLFKIFGVNLVFLRLGFIAAGALVVPLAYCLARRLMPPAWAALAAFLAIVLIDVPYYTYNHIFATITGLFALLLVIKFMETRLSYYLFFAGASIGVTILAKPFSEGFGALAALLIFMMRKIKFSHLALILAGALTVFMPCAFYFAIHGCLNELAAHIAPFGPNKPSGFYVYTVVPFSWVWFGAHLKNLAAILPYKVAVVVEAYYCLILYSPVIFPLAIFLLNRRTSQKYNLISKRSVPYLYLFTMFSIFISGQSLLLFGRMGRSFTMPVPFILTVYFLFMLNDRKLYKAKPFLRCMVGILTVFFVIYLSFLHFLRTPYARNRMYTNTLELERARGIKVTYQEKQLYEGIDRILSKYLGADEPVAVIGYYPHFAFVLKRENIFWDIEDIWIKFLILPAQHRQITELQDYLIERLKFKKPSIIISPVITARRYMPDKLNGFINKRYGLIEVFGPVYIDNYTKGIVNVYRLKE